MRKIFLIAILCLVPFIGQAQELQAPFAHPGLNHSRADLERMKEKVLAKEKPWIDGWDALCAFRDAQSDFKASPKPSLGGTDGTRQRASRDAMAAYYNILRWYVTGDEAHARYISYMPRNFASVIPTSPRKNVRMPSAGSTVPYSLSASAGSWATEKSMTYVLRITTITPLLTNVPAWPD